MGRVVDHVEVIRNRLVSRVVAVGAWLIAALNILNLAQTATAVLDAAAVNIGDLRVSLLLLLKVAAVLSILFWLAAAVSTMSERRLESLRRRNVRPCYQLSDLGSGEHV